MQPQNGNNKDDNPQQQMPQHVPISQIKEQIEAQRSGGSKKSNSQPINPLSVNASSNIVIKPSSSKVDDNKSSEESSSKNAQSKDPASATKSPSKEHETIAKESENAPTVKPMVAHQKTSTSQPNVATGAYINVLILMQFIALAVILFGFIPPILWTSTFLMVLGMLLVAVGIFVGVWAVVSFQQTIKINPKPNPNGFLVTGGPYKYQRHPMYFALITASFGLAIAFPTIPRLVAFAVLVFVLNVKVDIEEKLLADRYHHYSRYQKITGRIIPKFKKPKNGFDLMR